MPFATINGIRIHYIDRGTDIPILFIHPPVLSSTSFFSQVKDLSKEIRTVAFDIRGHGRSEATREPITYPLIVSDLVGLMDHLNIDKAFLCGYSTGGSVVLEFLLTHPHRCHGGILVGGLSEVHDLRLSARITLGMVLAKLGAIRALAFGLAWTNSPPKMFKETYRDAKQGNHTNAEQYYRYSLTYNCTERLNQIELPVLLIYGEKDRGFHSYAKILHDRLPKNELIFVRNVKHQIPTKASKQFHEAIRRFVQKYT